MHELISCKRQQSERFVNYIHSYLNQSPVNLIIQSKIMNHTDLLNNQHHIHLIIICNKLRLKHALALCSN